MSLNTLCDFFLFVSSNKKTISNKNLKDFYTFIETKYQLFDEVRNGNIECNKFQSLLYGLEEFLKDFLLFFYNKSIFEINKNQVRILKNKIEEKQNIEKQKDQEIMEEQKNSYQYQYRKSLNYKKIQQNETKKCLLDFLIKEDLNINIFPINYILFFKEHEKYRITIHKFILKMRPLIEKKAKKNITIPKMNKKCFSNQEIDNYTKRNNNKEINLISDKESLIQNKNHFINILSKVKAYNSKEAIPKPMAKKKKTFEKKKIELTIEEDDIKINIIDNNKIKNNKKKLIKVNNQKNKTNNTKNKLTKEQSGVFNNRDSNHIKAPGTPENKGESNYGMFRKLDLSKEIMFDDIIKKTDKSADDINIESKSVRNKKIKNKDFKYGDQIQCGCYLF